MLSTCDHCQTTLSHTAVGDFCLNCGITYHHGNYPDAKSAPVRVTHSFHQHTPPQIIDGVVSTATPSPKPSLKGIVVPKIDPHTHRSATQRSPRPVTRADYIAASQRAQATRHHQQRRKTAKVAVAATTMAAAITAMIVISWQVSRSAATPAVTHATFDSRATTPVAVSPDARNRDATRKRDLSEIATALSIYHTQNGAYPAGHDISVLVPLQYTNPPYLNQINYDPSSDLVHGKPIQYGYHSDGAHFQLQTKLEDLSDPQAKNGIYSLSD